MRWFVFATKLAWGFIFRKTRSVNAADKRFRRRDILTSPLQKQNELLDAIWEWSKHGERPVVLDLGSCTSFLKNGLPYLDRVRRHRLESLPILDSTELAARLLPKLSD